ncbi:MAG: fasciclin domain-containing protein [Caulobacter sp.]
MTMKHLLGAAAVAALMSTSAVAQTLAAPAKPAAAPAPAAPATTPPAPSIVTPAAVSPAPAPAAIATSSVVAKGDIVETLKADGHFKTFIKALDAANMTTVLKANKNLTVFAPTDAAFAALPAGELDRLLKSPAELQKLMTYHVINATVDSGKIKGAKGGVKTVAGQDLILDGSGAQLMANTADIIQADVRATNGTVHVIDAVLSPATAPILAATTGATTDAAATAPAAPEKPAPETTPTTPPPETPADAPETPTTPDKPAPTPQG